MDIIKPLTQEKYNIGIKLSGGADSSLIYYALCKEYANNNNINIIALTLNTDKKPYYISTANKIIDLVYMLTGKKALDHITISIKHDPNNYVKFQDTLVNEAEKKYNISQLYSGLTMNPPINDMLDYFKSNYSLHNVNLDKVLSSINTRDKERDNTQFLSDDFNILPFGTSNKKTVYKAYQELNILDELYPHTRSCESFSLNETHCGHCFFCAERIWGFNRLI